MKNIKLLIFTLLTVIIIPNAHGVTMPVKGGTNCGGGEWMDVTTGLVGCEAYYKARYASTLETFNYIFPAKYSYSPRSQFLNGEQYNITIETHNQNGDNVGGARLSVIECDTGYVLKSLNCIKEITNTGCSADLNGNPCSASSGNKFQIEKDYISKTLSFIRYYNSLSSQYTNMGAQWTHNYSAHLKFDLAKGIVGSYQGHRSLAIFKKVSNEWVDDSGTNLHLQENGNLWELQKNNDTIEMYNQDGQLVSYQLRNGVVYQLEYIVEPE
ncbi:MAG: DUF6531 domain-containing protein [Gammaproteobacteria bacterium]|nr:DUF6531 domain-containing protein [Gammaproteobacteria bacterium]